MKYEIELKDDVKFEITPISVAKVSANFEILSEMVKSKIADLNLESMDTTVENVALVKNLRSALNNERKAIDKVRKDLENHIFKDYNEFYQTYKTEIIKVYDNADKILKEKVDIIDAKRLELRFDFAKDYFAKCKETNPLPFLYEFEDIKIHITLSTSDNDIRKAILAHCENVTNAFEVITTYPNEDQIERLIELYIDTRDIVQAIKILNIENTPVTVDVPITASVKIPKKTLVMALEVSDTQSIKLKRYLELENIEILKWEEHE